jgi:dihydrofolate reductase
MSAVRIQVSMSADGYVAGPDVSVEQAMGVGGEALHEWMFAEDRSDRDSEWVAELREGVGAVVLGRRTFDVGLGHWGDVPYPAPSFVVTHRGQPDLPQDSGTFTFVTEGVERAIELGRAAAGDRDVVLMGADLSRQALAAGLVDEVLVDIVPVVLGSGARVFGAGVTHLRARVR